MIWPLGRKLAASGLRRGVREVLPADGGAYPRHAYDPLRRLKRESLFNAAFAGETGYVQYDGADGYPDSTGYDKVGNRRQRTVSSFGVVPGGTYSSSDANDRLGGLDSTKVAARWDANGNTLQFNLDGNTVWDQGTPDAYDLENRLTSAVRSAGTITLTYDGDGNRVKKFLDTTGVDVTTSYLVDDRNPTGYAQVLEEQATLGDAPTARYVYGLDLVNQDRSGTVHYYGYDGLGSVRCLINESGTVTDTYTCDAFGIQIGEWHQSVATLNHYRFTGEQWDNDLGLYYLRARYYCPDLGRFWTMDTFEGNHSDPLSLHKYLYAHGNPVMMVDPSGHELLPGQTLTAGGISGIASWTMTAIQAARARALFQLTRAYLNADKIIFAQIGGQHVGEAYVGGNVNVIDVFEGNGTKVVASFKSHGLDPSLPNLEGRYIAAFTRDAEAVAEAGNRPISGTRPDGRPFTLAPGAVDAKIVYAPIPENHSREGVA